MKYECPCGYVYDPALGDPDNGVAPGTVWEDVPEDWVCPICGLGKDAFLLLFPLFFPAHLANDLPNMVRIPPDAPASPRL